MGDTDFNFRKYDQDLGIFTQPDTLIQNVYDPQTLNRYSFERNNPYKYVDPDGHNPVLAYTFAAAFLVGATKYWYNTPINRNNPQWGKRLGMGALHGLNWGINAGLAVASSGLSLAGGILRFTAGFTLKTAIVAGLSTASTNIYDSLIDQSQINPVGFSSDVAFSMATSGLGFKLGGQFAPTKGYFNTQTLKVAYNYYLQQAATQGLNLIGNQLSNNPSGDEVKTSSGGFIRGSKGGLYTPERALLQDIAVNAPNGATAGDIIKGWRNAIS